MIKAILRFFAVFILAVFVVAFPLSIVLRDVAGVIFHPETAKGLVRESLQDSALMSSLVFQASRQMLRGDGLGEETSLESAVSGLNEDAWNEITRLIAPKELVQDTADQVVDAFTSWLNSESSFPDVKIDLAAWKGRALDNSETLIGLVLNSLPACDTTQVASLNQKTTQQLAESIPLCLPPEPFYSQMMLSSESLMEQVVSVAPDTIDLATLDRGNAPAELIQLKENLVSMRTLLGWSWVAVLAIGIVGVALGASGLSSGLKWVGWPLALSGALVLIFGLGLKLFSLDFLDQFLAGVLEQGSGAMGSLGHAIASGALNLISGSLLLQGAVFIGLGTASIVYSTILAKNAASPGIPIRRWKIGL